MILKINDIHGHLMGDKVLRAVGHLLLETVRDMDSVGRYGGEEMVVVMPQTTLPQARLVMERIKAAVAQLQFSGFGVTVSIGISEACGDAIAANKLFDRADKAMYLAKKANKNCVRVWPTGPVETTTTP